MEWTSAGGEQVTGIPQEANIYKRIGRVIARLRERDGLKQEQLGNAIGETVFTISRWENGSRKPKIEDLERLASFFKVDITSFFAPDNDQPQDSSIRILNRLSENGKLSEEDSLKLLHYALEITRGHG